ncbi:hypothetical protein MPTK1_5g12730 [Marchantia polymorpha subsp. ruderalis]|uniref:Uncharacterized protein n=2 Tax=Marchantia polymorpha TaxID=3197 RepID=A0AAF6BHP8_MARPO|nr:hypothetical protein MARPO_0092s0035 [Marchantia polymorpha]BBN11532.1 hypothetical protein Mp_5g12730 [Marchantia polymorpha subsp. ruderalis]|eukprot:PTQ33069.1 hypothetical protein MARPO_0092s0035 [Marchantia polymorpha]
MFADPAFLQGDLSRRLGQRELEHIASVVASEKFCLNYSRLRTWMTDARRIRRLHIILNHSVSDELPHSNTVSVRAYSQLTASHLFFSDHNRAFAHCSTPSHTYLRRQKTFLICCRRDNAADLDSVLYLVLPLYLTWIYQADLHTQSLFSLTPLSGFLALSVSFEL